MIYNVGLLLLRFIIENYFLYFFFLEYIVGEVIKLDFGGFLRRVWGKSFINFVLKIFGEVEL